MAATDSRNLSTAFIAGDRSLIELCSVLNTSLYNRENPNAPLPPNAYWQPLQTIKASDPARFEKVARVARLYIIELGDENRALQAENEKLLEKVERLKARYRKVEDDEGEESSIEDEETESESEDDEADALFGDLDNELSDDSDEDDDETDTVFGGVGDELSDDLVGDEYEDEVQSSEEQSFTPEVINENRSRETTLGIFSTPQGRSETVPTTPLDRPQLSNCRVTLTPASIELFENHQAMKELSPLLSDSSFEMGDEDDLETPSPPSILQHKRPRLHYRSSLDFRKYSRGKEAKNLKLLSSSSLKKKAIVVREINWNRSVSESDAFVVESSGDEEEFLPESETSGFETTVSDYTDENSSGWEL